MEKTVEEKKYKKVSSKNKKDKRKHVKHTKKIILLACVILFLALLGSTIFGIMAKTNSKIINGIKIDNIDMSNLEKDEAMQKLNEKLEQRQKAVIKLKYKDYEKEIPLEQLEIQMEPEEAINKAINIGRSENIIANNFQIIKRKFATENIDLNVNLNEEALDKILKDIGAELPGVVKEYTYSVDEKELIITKGTDGIIIDQEVMKDEIIRQIKDFSQDVQSEITIQVKDQKAAPIDIDKIYQEVYSKPQNAYIEEKPFKVVADKDGVDFDISIEKAKKMLEKDKEEYIIPLKITKAKVTIASFGSKAFPNRLATYTTKYNAGQKDRTTNLRIACEKINNYVIQPGETFSYNKVLGKRSVENGYKEAAIFANGKVEQGLGGGICQISSTLYNTVLLSNLEIVERHNHSLLTSYLPAGRDATVVYGVLDFQFKNTRKYPIQIKASLNSGKATVSIYGKNEETEYDVKINATVVSSVPFKTEKIEDPNLEKGKEVIKTKGSNGCRSVTYKSVYTKAGKLVSKKQISSDTYKGTIQVVRVGTGKKKTSPKPTTSTTPKPPTSPQPSQTPVTSQSPATTQTPSPSISNEPSKTDTPTKPETSPTATTSSTKPAN